MDDKSRDYSEKRTFIRISVETAISCTRQNKESFTGKVINLSGNGVIFECKNVLSVDEQLDATIGDSGTQVAPLKVILKIIRSDYIDSTNTYHVGATITQVS